jgi:isoleucyl-tRNA synthetase
MSKSLGNIIPARKAMNDLGADVLRLWLASTDYRNEVAVSDEILKRTGDATGVSATRRASCWRTWPASIRRRTCCPTRSCCPWIAGPWTRRAAAGGPAPGLRRLPVPPGLPSPAQLLCHGAGRLLPRYHQGPPVHDAGRQPAAALGADGAVPHRRCHGALDGADPVFTADEIWENLPGEREDSVLLAGWGPAAAARLPADSPLDAAFWDEIIAVRAAVNRRARGPARRRRAARLPGCGGHAVLRRRTAGAPRASGRRAALCADHFRGRRGAAGRGTGNGGGNGGRRPACRGRASTAAKCERCWHRRDDVGSDPRTSDALRPLREQRRGTRRGAPLCLIARPVTGWAYSVAAAVLWCWIS